ncbi:MAG: DUF3488 domain-containing protein [Deltaproteobacteria bacterium]|nr:DUF3488 domain-containing protein [Deltaproteobacteria bacterium]
MRFGLVHRVMTDALATLGVLALVASGQFGRAVNVAALVGLAVALLMRESWRQQAASRHADTILAALLVAVQIGRFALGRVGEIDLLIQFALGLQIIRVATRRGAAHDQQVIVLALLHLIAGTVVGGGLGYGLCFFGLLVVTPCALVLSHLRREVEGNYRQGARDRTGLPVDVPRILRSKRVVGRQFIAVTCLLSVPILLFTVALFIAFPRVGLSLVLLTRPKGGRMIGFSGKVDLGQIGTLRDDPTIALRVFLPDSGPPAPRRILHLRGTALDAYDGRSWSQATKLSRIVAGAGTVVPVGGHAPDAEADRQMLVELEPIDPPVLFIPPDASGLRVRESGALVPSAPLTVVSGPEDELRYQAATERGVQYQIFLSPDGKPTFRVLPKPERRRYLQVPPDLPARVTDLARSWTEGRSSDLDKARAIELRLRTQYRYDLSSPSGAYPQPLDHFLFESRRGHCEYYSTAMAVMLRLVGVPSRNVTGFVGGTYNRFGRFYAVRQGDAHSWVEAFIASRGWLTFDPTPPSAALPQSELGGLLGSVRDIFEAASQRWNHHVLGYDLQQQVGLFEAVKTRHPAAERLLRPPGPRFWLALLGLGLAAASAWWWQRRRRAARAVRDGPEQSPRSKEAALATSLYEALDRAMTQIGIARSVGTPPLRHARTLAHTGHPEAPEILALTERYLDARFGERYLTTDERRDFDARVRAVRQHRPARAGGLRLAAPPP